VELDRDAETETRADGAVAAAVVARAVALLDAGRAGEARELLARALASGRADADPALPAGFADADLERAFGDARAETEAMIDADGIALEAIRRARLDAPEDVALPDPGSPFHTRTLADLLERQGDVDGARAIRAALAERSGAGAAERTAQAPERAPGLLPAARADTIRTLERWLVRLRGEHR